MKENEEDQHILKWVKEHKKEFARKMIRDSGVQKSETPAAIFMAGLPGAGKTEFTKNLIKNSNLEVLRLDMDEIAEQIDTYQPKKADKYRKGATLLLSRTFDEAVKGKYSFIMDGMFGSGFALDDVSRALSHNYLVKVIYILQDPMVAWRYTVAREKVEHRAIEVEGFIKTYEQIWQNLRDLALRFGGDISLDLITKNVDNTIKNRKNSISIKDIDDLVKVKYNEGELRKQLNV